MRGRGLACGQWACACGCGSACEPVVLSADAFPQLQALPGLCLWRLFYRAERTLVRTAEATSVLDWRVTESTRCG